jgi:hypothetical protein
MAAAKKWPWPKMAVGHARPMAMAARGHVAIWTVATNDHLWPQPRSNCYVSILRRALSWPPQ